jgi:hypothetical protein
MTMMMMILILLTCHTRKHSIDSLQKTAILGTSHIIRKVLIEEEKYQGEKACDEK